MKFAPYDEQARSRFPVPRLADFAACGLSGKPLAGWEMATTTFPEELIKGRIWYFVGSVVCGLVGIAAIALPVYASVVIAQLIGAVCTVSGLILLISALLGRAKRHRVLDLFSAVLRIVVGILLLVEVAEAVAALTLLLAALFIAEGLYGTFFAFKMRGRNPAWIWILLNAIAAFVLGGLLIAKFPSDAAWAIGLLFGINSLFLAVALFMFALAMPQAKEV